jgi:PDZ domain
MNNNNKYEYVSVISVDPVNQLPKKEMKTFQTTSTRNQSQQFVTVLSINTPAVSVNIDRPELVEVHRVGDEKIGFGLKFEGGIKNNEKIVRLFIQSCSPNTPASRATASWGVLREGDEILEINSMRATQMSRLECVSNLKNSAGVIKLLILHRDAAAAARNQRLQSGSETAKVKSVIPPKPPVVPPRRINKTSFSTDGGGLKPVKPTPPPAPTTRETNYVNTKIVEIQSVIKPFDLLEKEFKIDSNQHSSSDEEKKKSGLTTSSEISTEQKVYENVEIIPPRPLPRLTILMNDLQKMEDDAQQQQHHIMQPLLPRLIDFHPKDTTTMSTSAEDSQKFLSQSLQAQLQNISYDDFKFFDEDFCEDGEKLGPILGQLKLSEAYFNQHWNNNKSLLPTIGEVEEDFVSMESNR